MWPWSLSKYGDPLQLQGRLDGFCRNSSISISVSISVTNLLKLKILDRIDLVSSYTTVGDGKSTEISFKMDFILSLLRIAGRLISSTALLLNLTWQILSGIFLIFLGITGL